MEQPAPIPAADLRMRDQWNALVACFLGWTLDAFDFFLVGLALTDIGATFGKSHDQMALSIVLTFAFRPVGAFIFGLLADRFGRRLPLMIDLVFYSLIEVLTGLAPNYATFMVLRALFGIGMGGEWGVGASLAMEKVPRRWRGVLSGLLQEGYALGYLLAALCYGQVFGHFHNWRILFFIGGLPALLTLFVRYGVKESEVWEKTKHASWGGLGKAILSHWPLMLLLTLLMTMMNLASHGTQDMYPTFIKGAPWNFTPQRVGQVTAISMVGAILGGVFFGLLSDRVGRRAAMIAAFIGALLAIPLWAFAPTAGLLILGAFLLQFMVQGAWGVIPAHITELSPDNVRGFLPGFAYQCGVLIAGSIAYLEALLAHHMTYAQAMASCAAIIFIAAIGVVACGKEKRGTAFGQTP